MMKNLMMGTLVGVVSWMGLLTACAQTGGGGFSTGSGGVAQAQPTVVWSYYNAAKKPEKEVAWLGLYINESSAAVASQLGLKPGAGLTVEFVASNSPAAGANFRTNDVLVELDGQMLVHPMQFRKLIQVHHEGDTVNLTYFRAGEKQTVSVKLGKTESEQNANNDSDGFSTIIGPSGAAQIIGQPGTAQNLNLLWRNGDQYYARNYSRNGVAGVAGGTTAQNSEDKEVTWLGVGTEESSDDEALSAQLALQPGEGLTVNYLDPDSPAAQAGLQTNDVLTALDDQMLVHPLQLRKLVEMHSAGDTVAITYCRAGKKQSATVKLGKTSAEKVAEEEPGADGGGPKNLQLQFPGQQRLARVYLATNLAQMNADKMKAQRGVDEALDQARKAIQEAAREIGTNEKNLTAIQQIMAALNRTKMDVPSDAKVIINKKDGAGKTILQTGEDGTLIIDVGAKKHLTARDKDEKILFDGDVDTTNEQAKVPAAIWEKARPLLDQLATPAPK